MKKFKYTQQAKYKGNNYSKLYIGNWGLKTNSYGFISKKQYLLIKQLIQKINKKIKFNITFNKVTTKKSLETRMGGGKGLIHEEQYFIKPGSIFLECYNTSFEMIFFISKIIYNKISLKLKLIILN